MPKGHWRFRIVRALIRRKLPRRHSHDYRRLQRRTCFGTLHAQIWRAGGALLFIEAPQ